MTGKDSFSFCVTAAELDSVSVVDDHRLSHDITGYPGMIDAVIEEAFSQLIIVSRKQFDCSIV